MSKKQTKKIKPPSIKIVEDQLEFDFSTKYIIQWHCINEDPDLKMKKGYKTRVRIVKDIVDNTPLTFNLLEDVEEFILHNLIPQFIYHEKKFQLYTNPVCKGFIKLNDTTFTYNSSTNIKYWIEVKQL